MKQENGKAFESDLSLSGKTETVNICRDDKKHVVAVFYMGKFYYTKTYFYDADGYIDKMVTVYASGKVVTDE